MSAWTYQDKEVVSEDLQGFVGFVYEITNKLNGKKYIGKKLATAAKTRQVNGKKKKIRVESDWKKYYGSNALLQADVKEFGPENFTRIILRLCKSKGECSYFEAKLQFAVDAILSDQYYNTWLDVRVRADHLKDLDY